MYSLSFGGKNQNPVNCVMLIKFLLIGWLCCGEPPMQTVRIAIMDTIINHGDHANAHSSSANLTQRVQCLGAEGDNPIFRDIAGASLGSNGRDIFT